jgi:hypothetical protein
MLLHFEMIIYVELEWFDWLLRNVSLILVEKVDAKYGRMKCFRRLAQAFDAGRLERFSGDDGFELLGNRRFNLEEGKGQRWQLESMVQLT